MITTKLSTRDIRLLSVGIPVNKGDPDVTDTEQSYYQQLLLIKEAEEDLIRRARRDQITAEEKMNEKLKEASELKTITEEEFTHSRVAMGEQNLGDAANTGTQAFCDNFNDSFSDCDSVEPQEDSPVNIPTFTCLKLCCGGKNTSPICVVTSKLVKEHSLCQCDCKITDKTSELSGKGLQGDPNHQPTFAEMIGAPSKVRSTTKLVYTPPAVIDGKRIVLINSCDFDEETKECQEMLVGNFIRKRLPYLFVKNTLLRLWELKGDVEMTTKGRHLFFFKFSCDEDKHKVLDMGHQHIASRVFFIKNWRPFIEFEPIEMKSIPTWVMLQDLPDQFWNPDGIGRVASALGLPLFLDKATEQRRRGRSFARVCIEMEVDSKFPNSITVEMDGVYNIEIQVAYNWIPPSCEGCKIFGHNSQNCPIRKVEEFEKAAPVKTQQKKPDAAGEVDVQNKKQTVDKDGWSIPRNVGLLSKATHNDSSLIASTSATTSQEETKESTEANNLKSKEAQESGKQGEQHKLSKSALKREKKKNAKQAKAVKNLAKEAIPSKAKYKEDESSAKTVSGALKAKGTAYNNHNHGFLLELKALFMKRVNFLQKQFFWRVHMRGFGACEGVRCRCPFYVECWGEWGTDKDRSRRLLRLLLKNVYLRGIESAVFIGCWGFTTIVLVLSYRMVLTKSEDSPNIVKEGSQLLTMVRECLSKVCYSAGTSDSYIDWFSTTWQGIHCCKMKEERGQLQAGPLTLQKDPFHLFFEKREVFMVLLTGQTVIDKLDQAIFAEATLPGGQQFCVTIVYGSNCSTERLHLWDRISHHARLQNRLCILLGDFNCIINSQERVGGGLREPTLPGLNGGLNIRNIETTNRAAIMRQIWALIARKDNIWVHWITKNYLRGRSLWSINPPADCSWCWRKLLQELGTASTMAFYTIGDGRETRLWYDHWHPKGPLLPFFQSHFTYDSDLNRNAFVSNIIQNGEWNIPTGLSTLVDDFSCLLGNVEIHNGSTDEVVWIASNKVSYIHKTVIKCAWLKPEVGEHMINTDGSLTGIVGGCGTIIRTHMGSAVFAATGSSRSISVPFHELQETNKAADLLAGIYPGVPWLKIAVEDFCEALKKFIALDALGFVYDRV
ncbi:hypothetical protein GIB67_042521 [Kingdonia uniflora]|uniref:DUF4283 domain-containing protein n=1 Tax=Kingdonia uniflora TaxID=39325 RepID=A0A7J7M147_9MAGN|nr:hypothetical protein GIB67_042521 [Kingdonia uniflora]